MKHVRFLVLSLGVLLTVSSCSKPQPDPATLLAEFIPHGWTVEFDTTGPLLDSGRIAHVAVFRHYDTNTRIAERMFCVIGPDERGKLQRYAATQSLVPNVDVNTDTYIPQLHDIVSLKKNVVSLTFLTASANNPDCHWQEQFKFRFDKKSKRFQLIGYDFTDVTSVWNGKNQLVTTTDSRNYITGNRIVRQVVEKDTLFKRTVKLRHTRPFMEDVKPGEFTVDTHQLMVEDGPIPETEEESASRYALQRCFQDYLNQQDSTQESSPDDDADNPEVQL